MTKSYVICISNDGYEASLELRKLYEVVSDPTAEAHGQLRIIDESGEDYLYANSMFVGIELPKAVQDQIQSAA